MSFALNPYNPIRRPMAVVGYRGFLVLLDSPLDPLVAAV
jgi:hypothetical protein